MSLFDGCPEIVDRHLRITDEWAGIKPRYMSPTSLLQMEEENLPDGRELACDLFGQMMRNWGVAGCPSTSSRQNWRFTKNVNFDDKERGPEVPLERTISRMTGEDWANQIPVDSGLLGKSAKTLDLAGREGDVLDLIELKVDANTPLSAAIQVLTYGLTNVFFQVNRDRLLPKGLECESLDPKQLQLHVLAPVSFYDRFEKKRSWLKAFEQAMCEGVIKFSNQFQCADYPRVVHFGFLGFPIDFSWDQSRHNDEAYRSVVKNAFDQRSQYYS